MFSKIFILIDQVAQDFIPFFQKEMILSSILFFIVLSLTLILRKQSPFLKLGLWVLLLIRLIVPPDLTFPYSGSQLLHQITGFGKRLNMQQISNPIESDLERVTERIPEFPAPIHLTDQNQIENSYLTAPTQDSPFKQRNLSLNFVLFVGWMLGIVILFFIYLRKLIIYHRVVAGASRIEEYHICEIFEYWKDRFRIKRSVRLVSSSVGLSPFTMGILKPVIFLPQRLLQSQDKDTIESVVAHEMAHVKHFDDLWIKIQGLIQVIYFFHPVVWIANSRIHLLRECFCDRVVLSSNSLSPDKYGKGLLSVLKLNLFGPEMVELLPCFGSLHKKLRMRVENIRNGKTLGKRQMAIGTALLLVMGLFLLPMGVKSKQDVKTGNESESASVQQDVLVQIDEEDEPSAHLSTVSEYQGKISDLIDIIDLFLRNINLGKSNGAFWMKMPGFKGTQILSLSDGVVIAEGFHNQAYPDSGRDIYIENEAGYTIVYNHLDNFYVGTDKTVSKWEPLGYLNGTDKDTLSVTIYFGESNKLKEGQFICPVWNAVIISKFGYRIDPFTKKNAFHYGVDYQADEGTPVLASADGTVTRAVNNYRPNISYGKYIIIDHGNGYETLYAHLSEIGVVEEQEVKRGEVIGQSGMTGRAATAQLHFEVHKDGEEVDPEIYILEEPSLPISFIRPILGAQLISNFGWRLSPFTRENEFHNGVDLLAMKGTTVLASCHGRVISTGFDDVWGNNITLEHQDGFETRYAHLDSILVVPGQDVRRWDPIGFSGMTGRAEGYHLHFEIHKDGEPVDPQLYMDF